MGQRRGNDFDDDGDVDETTKDRHVVEIKVMERGRANDHNIDDGCPPSREDPMRVGSVGRHCHIDGW
jgi:hypothetical protein